MYNLQLTPEQLEFRDTVRDFVDNEVKPAALAPRRLEPFEKPLLTDALEKASQMGLRALALSEEAGGAGADGLTTCIVLEELGAGDVDVAAILGHTAVLAPALFDRLMTPAQRERFLPAFTGDDGFHLAFAGRDPAADIGWSYHRPMAAEAAAGPVAARQGNDWTINGTLPFVANAPVAGLIAVQARTDPKKTGANGMSTLLVPRGTPGLTVRDPLKATGETIRWHHGAGAAVEFRNCRVPADHLLGKEGQSPFAGGAEHARGVTAMAAVNLGVARAAYDAAVDYSKIRRQGGRNIVEHQAIGAKLADCAIRLELSRTMIWKAAWALDHPGAGGRSAPELPLHVIARVYTAQAAHEVTLLAAECFGAMGVMRDMPLQKHVHDAMVFFHSEDADDAAKLAIAEAVAGYQRPLAA
ncbi:MAG TPA: acyl-CoA dehydrogenase family protein [Burkholderiales bacterium]|nr:acyl-CoA dehydrogenase family protein [Burkholderiales bacterium]